MTIEEISDTNALRRSVATVREAFAEVATEFGLTRENCPTNPAFITPERLESLHEKGVRFFGLYKGEEQIGFVALEANHTKDRRLAAQFEKLYSYLDNILRIHS